MSWSSGATVQFNTPSKLPYPSFVVLDQVLLLFSRSCPLVVVLLGSQPYLTHSVCI